MKKIFIMALLCAICINAKAQWSTTGTVTSTSNTVGIGTNDPQGSFDIFNTSNAAITPLISIRSNFNVVGNYGMIRFGDYTQTSQYQKGALIYESVAGSARGKFHIALENTDGSGSVSLSDAKFTVLSNGNIGIGTTGPNYKLDINGTSNATGQSWFSYGNNNMAGYSWTDAALTTNSIEIVNNNGMVSNLSPTLAFHRWGSGGPQFRLAADGSNVLYLESSGNNSARNPNPYGGGPNNYFSRLQIDGALTTTGNVGIGTTDDSNWQLANSTYKLAVGGSIIATAVTVKLRSAWPDYVFAPKYTLMPLTDVKTYIGKNHHLPDMPSAAQVEKDGLNLGEMNKLLLKKVEELTLYLIEKDRELNSEKTRNKSRDEKIQVLEERLNSLKKQIEDK